MLNTNDIETIYDPALIALSPLIVRNVLDRTDEGVIEEAPELQFQVTNKSGSNLVNLDVEVNYYSNEVQFIGTDLDCRLEPLKPGEVHTFSLLVSPPEQVARAELKVSVRRQTLGDKISLRAHLIFLGLILVLGFLLQFQK